VIEFVLDSYSPIILFLIPAIITPFYFIIKRNSWLWPNLYLFSLLTSAALYVVIGTIVEGISPFIGVAFIFAFMWQVPVVIAVGGTLFMMGLRGRQP